MTDLTDHDRRNEEQLRILRLELQHTALTDLRTSVLDWAVRWRAILSPVAVRELLDIVLGEVSDDPQD